MTDADPSEPFKMSSKQQGIGSQKKKLANQMFCIHGVAFRLLDHVNE